ncbi:hypothetical protein ASE04_28785 [Rhizobium sp. Root708]|nr:hypothetical protein ASE04_28785 [Rhizobium sp. Root708]
MGGVARDDRVDGNRPAALDLVSGNGQRADPRVGGGYHTTWIAMSTRKAINTSEAIHVTVRFASASTRGLGPRLGLNLWRRFCGPFACDDLFPAAMAAVSFEMV